MRDSGLAADFLGDGECAVHQRAQVHADRSGVRGDSIGFFDLAQNLRLADHHRIEAGRDPEDVTDRVGIPEAVEMFRNGVGRNLMKLAEKVADQAIVGTFSHDFDAIAGRKNHRFPHVLPAPESGAAPPAERSLLNASRSRISTGAVLWLSPTSASCITG